MCSNSKKFCIKTRTSNMKKTFDYYIIIPDMIPRVVISFTSTTFTALLNSWIFLVHLFTHNLSDPISCTPTNQFSYKPSTIWHLSYVLICAHLSNSMIKIACAVIPDILPECFLHSTWSFRVLRNSMTGHVHKYVCIQVFCSI